MNDNRRVTLITLPTSADDFRGPLRSRLTDHDHATRQRDNRNEHRQAQVGRPLRPLRRDAHDRARRHDRERGPALHPGRPGLLAEQPGLGGERVPDRLRRPAPARRPDRRPDRQAPRVPHRAGGVHRRVAGVRHRPEPGRADRRALRAGGRRRHRVRGDPRDDRDDVPGAPGAGQGDRRLQLRGVGRRVDRAARGRPAHRGHQLALDLLHQPARGTGDRRAGPAPGRGPRGHRPRPGRRHSRRRAAHRRSHARGVHAARGGRAGLGIGPDAGARSRGARAAGGLRRPAGTRGQPADAAAPVPLPQRRRREPGDGPARGGLLRDVLPGRPLHAADPGLQPARGGPGLPALLPGDGHPVARVRREADHGHRPSFGADRRTGLGRRGAAAVHAGPGGRELAGPPPSGDAPAGRRRGPRLPRPDDPRDVGRHAQRLGPRLRPREHHRPGGRRDRPRGARHPGHRAHRRPPRRGRAGRVRAERRLSPGLPARGGADRRRRGGRRWWCCARSPRRRPSPRASRPAPSRPTPRPADGAGRSTS